MNLRLSKFPLALLLLSCTTALVQAQSPGGGSPHIEYITPQQNMTISDYPIVIHTKVQDFTLAPPVQYWDRVDGPDRFTGHIHYTMDDGPIFASRKTEWVMEKPMGKSLPVGKHILRAELVTPNHEPLNPPSFAEITIICERGAKNGGAGATGDIMIDARGREQLTRLEQELQNVQKEVDSLKPHLHDTQ